MEKITDEYGQLHEENCALNDEGGSFDGCDCAMNSLVKEMANVIIEHLSYDMSFKNEKQRKSAIKMYLEDFK